ncbi:hypothetical protein SynA1825c_02934 [Synechococcus sp. A18-25c]|nr:hypothetical protein SynA1560_02974 [Synechococcus sp. A15-60]QNJ21207.1 hypothetical protein SynA1825c_02934 [Synechococcus sp. A18-25c]
MSSPSRQSKPLLMTSISSTCDFGHCSISALTLCQKLRPFLAFQT